MSNEYHGTYTELKPAPIEDPELASGDYEAEIERSDIPPGPLPPSFTVLEPKSQAEDNDEPVYVPTRPVQRFKSVGNPTFKVVGATPKKTSRFRTVGSSTYTTIKASISSMAELYPNGKPDEIEEETTWPETVPEDEPTESVTNGDDGSTVVDAEDSAAPASEKQSSGIITVRTPCYSPLCVAIGNAAIAACYSFVCPNRQPSKPVDAEASSTGMGKDYSTAIPEAKSYKPKEMVERDPAM